MKMVNKFIQNLPKIELHAHLSGCMRRTTLKELYETQLNKQFIFQENPNLDDCFVMFAQIHSVKLNQENLRRIIREVLEDFAADNVQYLELRSTPRSGLDFNEMQYIETIINEMQHFQIKNEMVCRMIISIDRAKGLEKAAQTLDLVKVFQNEKKVVGVDFSGHPNSQLKFGDYQKIFAEIRNLGKKITAHLGEVNTPESLDEIKQFLDAGVDRIGHLCYYDEESLQKIKQHRIPVEICFTSNLCTTQLNDPTQHHFQELHENDIPTMQCTDDTLCLSTTLSQEIQNLQTTFNLTHDQLVSMQNDAINSTFDKDIRPILEIKLKNYIQNQELGLSASEK